MASLRVIGRWTMTAMVVNCIIGSGIFGVPAELIRLLGRASPFAMIFAALAMATITLPVAEVASQFSETGGLYLYARKAFGRFVGLQVGWFWFLAIVGGGGAGVNLFLSYLAAFVPAVAHGWTRLGAIALLIAIPTAANYLGVRAGLDLSLVLTVVKMLPIVLVIALALSHVSYAASGQHVQSSIWAPGWKAWLNALLLLTFSYSGYEDALVPTGEVKDPHRVIPFALITALFICCLFYTGLQFAVVSTIGTSPSDRPLADAASALIGNGGGSFVALAVMVSTYGWISGAFFNAPRFATSLAAQGDCPPVLGRLHPRYRTPTRGVLLFALAVGLLSATGTFLWAIALTAGSVMIFYAITCAALIRLRHLQPQAPALRIPFGPVLAITGIAVSASLLVQVDLRHLALMSVTSSIAIANWWWAKQTRPQTLL